MKGLPILFNGKMVRAILEGRKTQTRRVVKHDLQRLGDGEWYAFDHKGINYRVNARHTTVAAWAHLLQFCPYGQPGDRLWVREATINVEEHGYVGPVYVESEYGRDVLDYGLAPAPDDMTEVEPEELRKRPSIHMPRSMSRILLEITNVRVERLQDISPDDAIEEGLKAITKDGKTVKYGIPDHDGQPGTDDIGWPWQEWRISPVDTFRHLWESINGAGSWAANPWVWVIEFRKL